MDEMTTTEATTATTDRDDGSPDPVGAAPAAPVFDRGGVDPRPLLGRAFDLAEHTMAAVAPDGLDRPTPCGMTVRELQQHLVMVVRRIACAGRAQPFTEWPVEAGDVPDHGFVDAWRTDRPDAEAAWADDALLDRPTPVPWGTFSGDEVVAVYANEVVVHTWDLAQATGQQPDWDDEVLELCERVIHVQLPTAERGPMWEAARAAMPPEVEVDFEAPFADAVEVPDDAPLIDRLVAWNGRRP